MIDFLKNFADTISSLLRFLGHSILSLWNLLSRIPLYLTYLYNVILNVPGIFIPFITATISLYVVFVITNRKPAE